MATIYELLSYLAAGFFCIPVLALVVGATRSMRTIVVSVAKNRNTVGVGNRRLATWAGSEATAKALGMIVGNQSVIYLETRRINAIDTVASLDKHASATPVIGGISRIVSYVGFLAAHIKYADRRRSDTDAATL